MATYAEKLKDPRWQKKRLVILERDNWSCCHCLDTETTLHVHHLRYSNDPWDAPDEDLKTLCEFCHKQEHDRRPELERRLVDALKHLSFQTIEEIIEAFQNFKISGNIGWSLHAITETMKNQERMDWLVADHKVWDKTRWEEFEF
jgi:hypothetical protein